jgi:hypothetical protein
MTQIRRRVIDADSEEKVVPSKLDGKELEGQMNLPFPRKIVLTVELTIDFDKTNADEETIQAVWDLTDLQMIDLLTKDLEDTLSAEKVVPVGFHRIDQ